MALTTGNRAILSLAVGLALAGCIHVFPWHRKIEPQLAPLDHGWVPNGRAGYEYATPVGVASLVTLPADEPLVVVAFRYDGDVPATVSLTDLERSDRLLGKAEYGPTSVTTSYRSGVELALPPHSAVAFSLIDLPPLADPYPGDRIELMLRIAQPVATINVPIRFEIVNVTIRGDV